MTSPNCQHLAVASPQMTSSDTHPGGLRLASLRFGLGACLMLFSACYAEVADDAIDDAIDESEPGSVQQAQTTWGVGRMMSRYWANVRCVDVPGGNYYAGARVQQWPCNGTNAQVWKVLKNDDGSWTFQAYFAWPQPPLCLDVTGASKDNGAQVQLWSCNGTAAQKFWAVRTESDFYAYMNVNSRKCLDLDISSSLNDAYGPWGSKLQQWDCSYGRNQQFWIEVYR
jgi:hypothetical protein